MSATPAPEPGSLDPELLEILCCPETHQSVSLATTALIARLNEDIAAGRITNRGGNRVTAKIDGGLARADRKFLYPIRNRLPVMLVDEAIPLG